MEVEVSEMFPLETHWWKGAGWADCPAHFYCEEKVEFIMIELIILGKCLEIQIV